jgi:hypothetical protein
MILNDVEIFLNYSFANDEQTRASFLDKVIIHKLRGGVSLVEQDTIEYVS